MTTKQDNSDKDDEALAKRFFGNDIDNRFNKDNSNHSKIFSPEDYPDVALKDIEVDYKGIPILKAKMRIMVHRDLDDNYITDLLAEGYIRMGLMRDKLTPMDLEACKDIVDCWDSLKEHFGQWARDGFINYIDEGFYTQIGYELTDKEHLLPTMIDRCKAWGDRATDILDLLQRVSTQFTELKEGFIAEMPNIFKNYSPDDAD